MTTRRTTASQRSSGSGRGSGRLPLLEREAELAALGSYWVKTLAGHGRLVLLGGEGGAGKTSVGFEFARRIAGRARFLVGRCDGVATPRALGPLFDVADKLGVQAELDHPGVRSAALFPRVRAALGRSPTLLLLEDLHWADEATLDLVRYLGRRMDGLPLLVVATFRDDEVAATHPLAVVMGDLATAAGVTRMQLPLLTEQAVAELVETVGRDVDAAALYRSTDGNPFFVTEVLAAGGGKPPATVRDAVLARAARLSAPARRVLDVAALIGFTAEIDLVLDVSGQAAAALDSCVEGGVLLDRETAVEFRHELARQAVVGALSPADRVHLHRQILARLVAASSRDHRRLALHAVACGDSAAVVRHAPRAAELAARLGSHREAAEHLRTALRHGGALAPAARADLLEGLSYECGLTSQTVEALDARLEAVALRDAAGDARRLGVDQRWLSRLSWFLGRNDNAKRYARDAVATLEPIGAGADLAMAYSNLSQLQMLSGSTEEALAWGERAREAALAAGDRGVEAHALNNIGTALLYHGSPTEGQARLDQSLEIALADGLEEHAARAWTNIGTGQAAQRMLAEAEQTLRAGIGYCDKRDLDTWSLDMTAALSGVLVERGRADEAVRLANNVLRHPHLRVVSRIPALLATGTVAVRSGDPQAEEQLSELDLLAHGSTQAQHRLPVALLRAEAAWTAGRSGEIVALTRKEWSASVGVWEPAMVAELAWWRALGGADDDIPFDLPAPFALMRDGRWREASDAWTAIGRPFWAALTLASGTSSDASEAVAALVRTGASATAQAVRRDLAQRGLPVPRGPRGASRANAAGLTARELEVLGYLVKGLSGDYLREELQCPFSSTCTTWPTRSP